MKFLVLIFTLFSTLAFAGPNREIGFDIGVLKTQVTPSNPSSGSTKMYIKGGTIALLSSAGVETSVPQKEVINVFTKQNYVAMYTIASGAVVDFDNGNGIVLSAPNSASVTLNNLADGGSYNLLITEGVARTYSFTANKKEGGALTVRCSPVLAQTTSAKHALFNFLRAGNNLYCTWIGDL